MSPQQSTSSLWSSIERKCFYLLLHQTKPGPSLLQVHAFMLKNALETNVNLLTKLITTCSSINPLLTSYSIPPFDGIRHARSVFDQRPQKDDTFLCNSMINAYAGLNRFHESFALYRDLRRDTDFSPNGFTFMTLPKSCGLNCAIWGGREIHSQIVRYGFSSNLYVSTALVDMYTKFGNMDSAVTLFDEMPERSLVSSTAIISGYVKLGDMANAKKVFGQISEKDTAVFNTMIDGFVKLGDMDSARKLFDEIPESNVVSWTSMVYGYCLNGKVEYARSLFDAMPEKNLRSWNVMINGYCQNKQPYKALRLFHKMQSTTSLEPDEITIISVLPAIADLGALELGTWVHNFSKKKKFDKVKKVCTALIDMYAKSGEILEAKKLFNEISEKEIITWNALINGLAVNGCGNEALEVFSEMKLNNIKPNETTMVGLLCACNHNGLVKEGKMLFESMKEEFGLTQKIEHYGCMVDLLGRAGCLEEAEKLIESMPYEANGIILSSFLFACGCYKDVKRAERVLQNAILKEPWNDGNYVMLRNLYVKGKRWGDVDQIKGLMKRNGANKEAGCSVIEVDGRIREFLAGDRMYNCSEEGVFMALWQLQTHMKGEESLLC